MTPLQCTFVERALVLAQELEATSGLAPDVQIIHRDESFLLGSGCDFLRRAREDTYQDRAGAFVRKAWPAGPAAVA